MWSRTGLDLVLDPRTRNSKPTQPQRNTQFFHDNKWSGAQIYYSCRWWHVWQNNSSWQNSKIFIQCNNSKEMICQIDCNNRLQPFSICGLLKMLSGNAELCTDKQSTDNRLIVFRIPFTEMSEIVLGHKLKKRPDHAIFWKCFIQILSNLPYRIKYQDLKAWNQTVTALCKMKIFLPVTSARAICLLATYGDQPPHRVVKWQNSAAPLSLLSIPVCRWEHLSHTNIREAGSP